MPSAGGETGADDPLEDALLFRFSRKHQQRHDWLLPVMITASLVLHGLLFYLVQAANPVPRAQTFASARLSMLNTGAPQDQPLMQWINDHDPASIARHSEQIDPPAELTALPFEAGFEQHQPELLPVSRDKAPDGFPPVAPPGVVQIVRETGNSVPDLPETSARSVIRFIPEIALANSAPFSPPPVQQIPQPTRFLIQISSQGRLEEAFLQNSSGDQSLDRYALAWLQGSRFDLAGKSAETWMEAIVVWGSEIFPPVRK